MFYCFIVLLFLFSMTNCSKFPDGYVCTYLDRNFTDKIKRKDIKLVVELGSYWGYDAAALSEYYNCPAYTFEADPTLIDYIKKNLVPFPQVTLIHKAVWHETKNITFNHSNFPGTSSIYQFNLKTLAEINHTTPEKVREEQNLNMSPVKVEAIRLDDWMREYNIKKIDMLCIDIQGATLNALISLGKRIKDVKYIICEVEYKPIYLNEPLWPEIRKYLIEHGFEYLVGKSQNPDESFSDVLFVNTNYVQDYF